MKITYNYESFNYSYDGVVGFSVWKSGEDDPRLCVEYESGRISFIPTSLDFTGIKNNNIEITRSELTLENIQELQIIIQNELVEYHLSQV